MDTVQENPACKQAFVEGSLSVRLGNACLAIRDADNAVAEATFKVIKTEFVWNETFHTLEELKIKLWDYVNWYNHHRVSKYNIGKIIRKKFL